MIENPNTEAEPSISLFLKELGYNYEHVDYVLKGIAKIESDKKFPDTEFNIWEMIQGGAPLLMVYPDQIVSAETPSIKTLDNFLDLHLPNLPVYVLPCWEANGDGDFAIKNFKKPRALVGTLEDLDQFCHARPVCLDMVLSYASVDHDNVKEYLDSPPHNGFVAELTNEDPQNIPKSHRGHPDVTGFDSKYGQRWLWTTFSEDQVNLNYSSPQTLLWMLETIAFYLDLGVSAIRLDAVGFTWTDGTGAHLHAPQCHSLVKIIRNFIDSYKPGTLIIAQADYASKPQHDYVGDQDNEAHLMYRYEFSPVLLHAILSKQKAHLEDWVTNLVSDADSNWISFLSTHDGVFLRPWAYPLSNEELGLLTDASFSRGGQVQYYDTESNPRPATICSTIFSLLEYGATRNEAINRILLAHAILLALPGVPALYFNSMLGMNNWTEWEAHDRNPRTILRERYTEDLINMQMSTQDSIQNQLLGYIGLLVDTRIKHPAFGKDSKVNLKRGVPGSILAWSLENNGTTVECYFNIGEEVEELEVKGANSIIGKPVSNGKIILSPLSFAWVE